jgi:hypothetical protein
MYNIITMLLTQLKSVIIFVLFGLVISNQIYTKTQLRGFRQKRINEKFEEKIKEIIQNVITCAYNNITSYTEIICFENSNNPQYDNNNLDIILNKKLDLELIQRLQETLIDSNIIIIEYYHQCYWNNNQDEKKINSRKLIIEW